MRSSANVHNPLLKMVAAARIQALPPEAREALRIFLTEFRDVCRAKGDGEWKRNKFWNASYYKVMAVYSLHLARLCRDTKCETRPLENTGDIGRSMGGAAMTEGRSVVVPPTHSLSQ